MNAALFSAVQSVNADHLSFKDHTDPVSSSSPEAHTQVGGDRHISGFWHDLTPAERDAAIELAELKEIECEQAGQHVIAGWFRELQAQLKEGRKGAKA